MYCVEMDWCLRIGQSGYAAYDLHTAPIVRYDG